MRHFAARIAADVIGRAPVAARRFTTGARHYVFDIEFAERPPVVVRIGDTSAQLEMAGAVYLSELLRPRGVPLPAILAEDMRAEYPWLLLERSLGRTLVLSSRVFRTINSMESPPPWRAPRR